MPACRSVAKTCLCTALHQQHSNSSVFCAACSAHHLVQPVLVLPFRSMGRASLQRTDELQEHHRVQQALVEARQVILQAAAQSGSCLQPPPCTGTTSAGL